MTSPLSNNRLNQHPTLTDWIEHRAAHQGDKTALHFIAHHGEEQTLTFAELSQRARLIAAELQSRYPAGTTALILFPSGLDYVVSLLACFYAGLIGVPVNLPGVARVKRVLAKLHDIAADCEPSLVITGSDIERHSAESLGGFAAAHHLNIERLDQLGTEKDDAPVWVRPQIDGDTIAFLQYTSGSTGLPKGVINRHRNVLANLEFLACLTLPGPDTVVVSWLPLFHDLGLIMGILSPLAFGNRAIYMAPTAFVSDPLRWLELATETRATVLPCPSFALQLCTEAARAEPERLEKINLSAVASLVPSAEPVLPRHIEAFHETFSPGVLRRSAIKPSYGLAEATLIASGSVSAQSPLYVDIDKNALERDEVKIVDPGVSSRRYVSIGSDFGGQDLRIVSPDTFATLPAGRVGEIWISGEAVADGYWRQSETTRETFAARTAESDNPRRYLRTGDLGFLHDGHLFITGRLKDVLIFRGQCHYPNDIEATAASAHADAVVNAAAAFSVDDEGEERLVVVVEVLRHADGDAAASFAELVDCVRAAIAEEHQLATFRVVPIRKGTLPRTTSGKVRRNETRRAWLDGTLRMLWDETADSSQTGGMPDENAAKDIIVKTGHTTTTAATAAVSQLAATAQSLSARIERLSHWLGETAADVLGTVASRNIDPERSLFTYGLDSLSSASLISRTRQHWGVTLPESLIFDHPSPRALASWLEREMRNQGLLPPVGDETTASARDSSANRDNDEIAIIGMAFRLPGADGQDADSDDAFWELLADGKAAIRPMPPERFRQQTDIPGFGSFLNRIEEFDAGFFGMSPREAINTDPQQRLLLEVAWHALEDAGLRPSALRGNAAAAEVGVFVGIGTGDYSHLPFVTADSTHLDAYYGTGNSFAAACGRLSYYFGWEGPSVAVDTACSSSHSAVHLACQALKLGECDVALAAGVKLQLLPEIDQVLHKAGMLAPDGRCKTLDAAADGYVRGEGCIALLLKSLSRAIADGDAIRAVIRGSLIRQDGASSSLSAPNGDAQRRLLTKTLARAGLQPNDIDYLELHGTGTRLGDPIEYQSAVDVFRGRNADDPLWVGSVKTNIGHLEAAAGASGLVKAILSLERAMIPPLAGLKTLNPLVDPSVIPARIADALTPWPQRGTPRRVGVTSYGFAGTIAHVILEQAPETASSARETVTAVNDDARLFVLSAKSASSLQQLRQHYQQRLEDYRDLAALANALARKREHLPLRLAFAAADRDELAASLQDAACGDTVVRPPKVGFLFTGQGAQYIGMGRQLYAAEPAFRAALDETDAALRPALGESIIALMHSDDETQSQRLDQTAYAQPALFAIGYALARLWQAYGVEPAVLVGHSIGEFAAMVIAGSLDLKIAATMIARRGALMQALPADGGMLATRLTADVAAGLLQSLPPADAARVSVAVINGPEDVVLSGAIDVLEKLQRQLESDSISARRLTVSHAFHSQLLNPMLDAWQQTSGTVIARAPQYRFISTLTGVPMTEAPDAAYWREHARSAVRFAEALRQAAAECDVLLEIGPHAILTALAQRNQLSENWPHPVTCVASLRRGGGEVRILRETMATLYTLGQNYRWDDSANDAFAGSCLPARALPRYPFDRQPYWLDYDEDAPRTLLPLQPQPQRSAPNPVALYTQQWEALEKPPQMPESALEAHCWIVAGNAAEARHMSAALHARGVAASVVPADSGWESIGGEYQTEDFIVYLPDDSAETVADDGMPPAAVWTLIEFARSLQQHNASPRMLLATRMGQSVGGETCRPLAAAIWGAARALAIEYPNAGWLMLDHDAADVNECAALLLQACGSFADEDALAVRGGNWHHPRLTPVSGNALPQVDGTLSLDTEAIYLIAGAYGALGRHTAEWLIRHGARHLLLTGRQTPRSGVAALIEHWRSSGIRVDCRETDIASPSSVASLFEEIGRIETDSGHRLAGVFHCAGVGRFNPLDAITQDDYATVARAKINGSWLLHQHTRTRRLDWFVCFTSISGVWGSRLQIHYGAANAYQDALMRLRRAQGLPALGVAWGPWGGGAGMSEVDASLLNYLRMAGIYRLAPSRYLATLDRLAAAAQAQTASNDMPLPPVWVAAEVDWTKFVPLFALYCHTGVYERCMQVAVAHSPAPRLTDAAGQIALTAMTDEERRATVEAFVRAELARALRVAPDRIGPDVELLVLGMDSILVMDFARVCETTLGIKCSLKALFEHNTPALLGNYLLALAENMRDASTLADTSGDVVIEADIAARFEPFPLTELQYAYWIGRQDHYALGGIACHAYLEADSRQGIDLTLLERCWNLLIARHDALRLVIDEDGRQRVLTEVPHYTIRQTDLADADDEEVAAHCAAWRGELSHQVLDPANWPLFDLRLTRLPDGGTRLHVSIDMLINDAASSQILWDELVALYRSGGDIAAAGLMPFEIAFRDYVLAKRNRSPARQRAWENAREYWLAQLPELPPAPQLPLRAEALRTVHPQFIRLQHQISAEKWQRLRSLASRYGATPASLVIAAFAEVLAAWSAEPRFCLNLTIFDRLPWHADVPRLVGDFTAVTLLPLDCSGAQPFGQRAAAVNGRVLECLEQRDFSAVDVLREWNRGRAQQDLVSMPVVFTSQLGVSDPTKGAAAGNPLGSIVHGISQTPQVWLDHQASELDGALLYNWDAVDALFPPGVLEAMFDAYNGLLERLAADEAVWQQPLAALLPPSQQTVRRHINDTAAPLADECLDQLFFATAARTPDAPALFAGGRCWRYAELAGWSTGLARRLIAAGVQPGDRIAVAMHKGAEQIAACLAIQAAGAAYVPLDADTPTPRLASIIAGSDIRIVLTQQEHADTLRLRIEAPRVQVFDTAYDTTDGADGILSRIPRNPADAAYVIYTSGSTGTPKGVLIDHRGAVNTVLDINRRFGITAEDRVFGLSSLYFDLSVYDIFGTFAAGGALVLPDAESTRDPAHWLVLVRRHGVTVWNSVPALLELLLEETEADGTTLSGMRHAFLSGDWIPLRLPGKLAERAPRAELIAMGGATEASIWSNWYTVGEVPSQWTSIPYGYPLTNQSYRVLDAELRDRPDYVIGDLYIGGIGVALGYENDPKRTAASFITDPASGERLYRTGDLARYWQDGTLEFLGRRDFQVKIAGNRIELGEIEAALTQHGDIREAVVDVIGPARGEKRLAAWVILQPDAGDFVDILSAAPDGDKNILLPVVHNHFDRANVDAERLAAFWSLIDQLGMRMLIDVMEIASARRLPREQALAALNPAEDYRALAGQWLDAADGGDAAAWPELVSLAETLGLPRSALLRLQNGAAGRLEVLRGNADPLELFYGNDNTLAPEQLTQMNPLTATTTAALAEALRALSVRLGRPPRVLEVGARSGVAARELLMLLDDCACDYTVSDASKLLVEQARDTLSTLPAGHSHTFGYTVFDTEKALAGQNLPEHDFDAVITVNALHRSRNINALLPRLLMLLQPGGWLLAPEMTRNSVFQTATVALLEHGYTALDDCRHNDGLPLLDAAAWQRELVSAGFDSAVACTAASLSNSGLHLLVAQAPPQARRFSPQRLVDYLGGLLPAYMVPQTLIRIDALPLSATGKVLRSDLPRPERQRYDDAITANATEEIAALSELGHSAAALAEYWRDLLGIARLGPQDHFFELGGDSLIAVRLIEKVRHGLHRQVALRDLFASPRFADFVAVVEQAGAYRDSLPPLLPDPDRRFEPFPLTDVQQAYWIGRQKGLELSGVSTHLYVEIDVTDIPFVRLEQAWQRLIARHDMLRATIDESGRQRILPEVPPYRITCRDLCAAPAAEIAEWRDLVRMELSHEARDPQIWPLFEVRAAQLDGERVRLCISLDNLICDGRSMVMLLSEWAALARQPDIVLHPLTVGFRDYVMAAEQWETRPAYRHSLQYWLERLDHLPPAPALPSAGKAAPTPPRFGRREARLTADQWRRLRDRAAAAGVTPNAVLLTAYGEILAHWSAAPDFTLNLTLFQRPDVHPDLPFVVGDFTSLVLLAFIGSGSLSFADRAAALQQQLWTDLEHAEVSAVRVLREAARRRGSLSALAMPVVFTSGLGVDGGGKTDGDGQDTVAADWLGEFTYGISQTPQVWIDHQVVERDGELVFNWDCVDELFPEGLLDTMFAAYCALLQRLSSDKAAWYTDAGTALPPNEWANVAPITPNSQATETSSPIGNSTNSARNAEIETLTTAFLTELTGIDAPPLYANFFDLGATSLHLIRLRQKLQHALTLDFPVVEVFNRVSISALSSYLAALQSPVEADLVPDSDAAMRPSNRNAARADNARRRKRMQS